VDAMPSHKPSDRKIPWDLARELGIRPSQRIRLTETLDYYRRRRDDYKYMYEKYQNILDRIDELVEDTTKKLIAETVLSDPNFDRIELMKKVELIRKYPELLIYNPKLTAGRRKKGGAKSQDQATLDDELGLEKAERELRAMKAEEKTKAGAA
jgi:alpha-L-fucosidase